ncbi:tricorn protease domain 2-containing protein [Aureobasidium pullulans]|nr:tricorn protease domain 2-containing protein [Aureobasidium pullulans]
MAAQLRHQSCAHVPSSVHELLDSIFPIVSCANQIVVELAGIHLAIGPLLSGCYKIVTTVNQLHQSYKFLPMTLANIVTTCNLTRITLGQLDSALAKDFDIVKEFNKELVEQFDGIKIGCTITLSLLEKHVTQLLNVASSEVPLKAQHTSRTDKWKALYNESDMKELLGQLKDNNTLLNTILNVLQRDQQRVSMSKQDKMMDMMANQEKTLQNMLRARGSFRKYLQEANVPLDNEVASILTARTSSTALTAFDFDSIIMRTSVYKRLVGFTRDDGKSRSMRQLQDKSSKRYQTPGAKP